MIWYHIGLSGKNGRIKCKSRRASFRRLFLCMGLKYYLNIAKECWSTGALGNKTIRKFVKCLFLFITPLFQYSISPITIATEQAHPGANQSHVLWVWMFTLDIIDYRYFFIWAVRRSNSSIESVSDLLPRSILSSANSFFN